MKKVCSYDAGKKFGEKIFWETIISSDPDAIIKIEKAKVTCLEYYFSKKLDKTKSGKKLTKEKRAFYKGAYDYLIKPTYNGYFDK